MNHLSPDFFTSRLLAVAAAYENLAVARTDPEKGRTAVLVGGAITTLGALGFAMAGSPLSYAAASYAVAVACIGALMIGSVKDVNEAQKKALLEQFDKAATLPKRSMTTSVVHSALNTMAFTHVVLGFSSLGVEDRFTPSIVALVSLALFYWFTRAREADAKAFDKAWGEALREAVKKSPEHLETLSKMLAELS